MRTLLFAGSVLAAFAGLAPASWADTPTPGWQLTTQPKPVFGAATTTLPGGDIVTWDGLSVDRWTAAGQFVQNLATFQNFGFPSFLEVRPDGTEVVLGESSNNQIHRVPLDGSGELFVTTIVFNFDAVFEDDDDLILSAATGGFNTGNDLLRLNVDTAAETLIAHVPGPSGPIALDAVGNLYYATQDDTFPASPGSTDVLQFTAAQLASGMVFDEMDATVVASGFDGGSSIAVDPVAQGIYLAESSLALDRYRVLQVGTSPATSTVVVDGDEWITGLDFGNAGGSASFEAFQPADGSFLTYNTSDFSLVDDRVTVRPKRPTMSITGPGLSGVGSITLAVDGALPNGAAFLLFSSQGALSPTEVTSTFPGFLLHSQLVAGKIRRVPFFLPVDGSGRAEFTLQNPGNLNGKFGWQFWIATNTGAFIGSAPVDVF